MYQFKWIRSNLEKVARHGVTPAEAEYVVNCARRPYPQGIDDDKILVRGQTAAGRFLQVIFVLEADGQLFVIHARPLTANEKKRCRRRAH